MMISYGFIITSLIVVLIPGTGVIYTVSTGISGSKKESMAAALGCTAGIIPHLIAGTIGLSALLYTSSLVFRGIKFLGAAYLLYLGIGMIRDRSTLKLEDRYEEKNSIQIIMKGILINLLNPKLTLFFFSFLPQFISADGNGYLYQLLILGGVFMAMTLGIFILYGISANSFKTLVLKKPAVTRTLQRAFGCLFIGLAAKLAFTEE